MTALRNNWCSSSCSQSGDFQAMEAALSMVMETYNLMSLFR
ncbi:hypothetical protein SAMN05720354_10827 [Nitrosospira sp. Nsp1]|nr:hypothetical protein SAMN05720354_10827 [Nitrosospira sp. Nsp1]